MMNDSWRNEFERAKGEGDLNAINKLYNKVKVALNGIAQSKGEETVRDFEALKNEIENYAIDWKKNKTFMPETEKEAAPPVEGESTPSSEPNGGLQKSLLNRAFKGATDEAVKASIEKHGLTYEPESHESARIKAKAFIDEVGEEAALESVRKNEIEDGAAAFIWADIIDRTGNEITKAAKEGDTEEVARLQQLQAELISEFDKKARSGGRFISALDNIYKNSNFEYSAERKISEFKEMNGGTIPVEVEAKFREYDKQLKEINERLQQAEERAKKAEENKAIEDVKEDIARKSNREKKIYGKSRIAKGLDDLASAMGAKLSATGEQSAKVTNALKEIGRG